MCYCHTTIHLLLDDCFWSRRNLHSSLRKSTTRKSTFGSSHSELIWKKMLLKSRQNSWKTPAKEPILQQRCMLEVCSCTKRVQSQSPSKDFDMILSNYFKNLRTTFLPRILFNACFNTLRVFVTLMLSPRTIPNITIVKTLTVITFAIEVKWFYL